MVRGVVGSVGVLFLVLVFFANGRHVGKNRSIQHLLLRNSGSPRRSWKRSMFTVEGKRLRL